MSSAHGDGRVLFALLSGLQENTQDTQTAALVFAAMVRIRVLETRIEETKAEIARLEAVTRVGY